MVSKNDDPGGCPDRAIGECEPVCACCGRDMHPEVERLRARDEAAKAVAQAWAKRTRTDWVHPEFRELLDALARAHEEGP